MVPFHYRCPNTRMYVQAVVEDDPTRPNDHYEPITCYACTRVHYVNPKTAKVLGADDDDE